MTESEMKRPEVGDVAPGFDLPDDRGGRLSSTSWAGRPYVLYFYPRDNAGKCIDESRDFSRIEPQLAALGVTIAGISPDSLRKHASFRAKQTLTVPLLSDEDRSACRDHGVWVEKSMYGRAYMGVERTTFLVDAGGHICRVWRKVRVAGHADEVLEAVKSLLQREAA